MRVEIRHSSELRLAEGGVWARWADGRQPVLLDELDAVSGAIREFRRLVQRGGKQAQVRQHRRHRRNRDLL